jgi:intraflagellar transport protein 88
MLKPKAFELAENAVDLLSDDADIFKEDELRSLARRYRKRIENFIMIAARLIATVVEPSLDSGFDWVLDTVKSSQIPELTIDLELAKALQFLNLKDFKQVNHYFLPS